MNPDDIPVFDRGRTHRSALPKGGIRTAALGADRHTLLDFKSRAKPGKPVPFHEPDPDRLAKAELIRRSLEAQEARRAAQRRAIDQGRIEEGLNPINRSRPVTRTTPIVDEPNPAFFCAPEDAVYKAERDVRVIYFESLADAELSMGGRRDSTVIKNAMAAKNSDPYGWSWARVGDGRRRRRGTTGKL